MGTSRWNNSVTRAARRLGFRSGFEQHADEQLKATGLVYEFEGEFNKFHYYKPVVNGRLVDEFTFEELKIPKGAKIKKRSTYTCDFRIVRADGTVLFVETKGQFHSSDRTKHKLVRDQNPGADIRFIFSSDGILRKNKKGRYRYSDWARDEGFEFHIYKKGDKFVIPKDWYE